MTWLLQPLDTHVFRKYKAYLRQVYQEMRGDNEVTDLDFAAFLQCVYRTIRSIMQGTRWASAFHGVGFGAVQAGLEQFVLRNTGLPKRRAHSPLLARQTLRSRRALTPATARTSTTCGGF